MLAIQNKSLVQYNYAPTGALWLKRLNLDRVSTTEVIIFDLSGQTNASFVGPALWAGTPALRKLKPQKGRRTRQPFSLIV